MESWSGANNMTIDNDWLDTISADKDLLAKCKSKIAELFESLAKEPIKDYTMLTLVIDLEASIEDVVGVEQASKQKVNSEEEEDIF